MGYLLTKQILKSMKKNLFYLFALICSMALFTACSDDDETPAVMQTSEIAGSYTGTLELTLGDGEPSTIPDVPVTLTADEDGSTVTVSLNYNLGGYLPLQIAVDCSTQATESQIALNGSADVPLFESEFPTTVTGTADGTNLNLAISVDGMASLGFNVEVDYTGTK